MKSCIELKPGERAMIDSVLGEQTFIARFAALGIRSGNEIEYIRKAPLGDPIEISVGQTHIALRAEDAAKITLQPHTPLR